MVGAPGRLILLASVVVVLAGTIVAAWRYELRPSTTQQAAAAMPQRPDQRALSPEEESYAAALWEIQRQVTQSAVAMSFAGIGYETDNHDAHLLEQKIEPVAKFFGEAEPRVHGLTVPPSMSKGTRPVHRSDDSLPQSQRRDARVHQGRRAAASRRRSGHERHCAGRHPARRRGALAAPVQATLTDEQLKGAKASRMP